MTPEDKLGQRVAWVLFGLLAIAHVVVLAISFDPRYRESSLVAWALLMLYTAVVYGVLGWVVRLFLPHPSRAAYRLTAWIAFGVLMGLSGVSCFVAGPR